MSDLTIAEIIDKEIWEQFIQENAPQSLFQSWLWGEVVKNSKFFWRLGIFKNSNLMGIAQVEKITAKRGTFLEIRHGPILKNWNKDYFGFLATGLSKIGKEQGASFIRMSPLIADSQEYRQMFAQFNFRSSPIHAMNAELCWVVDLHKNEDELLLGMRKTTRYLVRQAEKMGVVIEESDDIQRFLALYQQTAVRHGFVQHTSIEEEFALFSSENKATLLFGVHNNETIAGALILFYGREAIYHHGASLSNKIPASYLIQWHAMKLAKKRGCRLYNLWGIAPEDKPHHPWQGLTMFKKGFGGYEQRFIHAHDRPLSWKYAVPFAVETIRRIKRGY